MTRSHQILEEKIVTISIGNSDVDLLRLALAATNDSTLIHHVNI